MSDVRSLGILGAGTMGAGIAQVAAEAGIEVELHDPIPGATDGAIERIRGFLTRHMEKGDLSAEGVAAAVARIQAATSLESLAAADVVVEAIPEDLELKREAFRRLDGAAADTSVLATNTSSLSIARIAAATARPERVVGMHFFNPVPLMPLVEVIAGPMTDAATATLVADLARRLGKTPVMAADTPGFIVNRVARPYYLEAFRMLGEGVAGVMDVDAAMREVGFRMGPFELVDAIGVDVNFAVSESVFEAFFGDARYRPHPLQRVLLDAGRLGRKSGGGCYDYGADGARGAPWSGLSRHQGSGVAKAEPAQIVARILATIVNEAASAVAEGVATPDAIDIAMRLGTNWPDGPLAWGERIGLSSVVHSLDALHATVPDGRYRVTPLLRARAESDGSFFAAQQ